MAPCAGPAAVVYRPLMETRGFPLFGLALAGSRPGGRVTSLRRQRSNQERRPRFTGPWLKRCLIQGLPCAARIGRPAQNSPALRAQTAAPEGPAQCCAAQRLRRGFWESPRVSARACVIDEKSENRKAVNSRVGRVSPQGVTRHPRVGHDNIRIHFPGTRTNSSMTPAASAKARCVLKAPSEPLSSGATGGEVRRSCLSGRSPRVLRRPPVVSSARQSAAKPTTGSAGSPFLPTSLATQRSRAPAGARPGQRKAKQRKAAGLHQRPANKERRNALRSAAG